VPPVKEFYGEDAFEIRYRTEDGDEGFETIEADEEGQAVDIFNEG
jgi:hypothetical protein